MSTRSQKEASQDHQEWSNADIISGVGDKNARMDVVSGESQETRAESRAAWTQRIGKINDTQAAWKESYEKTMRTAYEMQTTLDQLVERGVFVRKQETGKTSHHSDLPMRIRQNEMDYVVGPVFTGVDLRPWLEWMENHFLLVDYTDLQKLKFSKCFFDDEATSWLQDREGWLPFQTWGSMKESLWLRFGERDDPERIRISLENEERWKHWTQKVKDRVLIDKNSESFVEKAMESHKETESQACQEKEESLGKIKETEKQTLQEKETESDVIMLNLDEIVEKETGSPYHEKETFHESAENDPVAESWDGKESILEAKLIEENNGNKDSQAVRKEIRRKCKKRICNVIKARS